MLTVGAFLLLLGPLIVLHELGHYWAGRAFGVRAEVFSVGIGKELWHRIDKRGTRWRFAAIPLGGYVLFAGDADASSRPDPALDGASAERLKGTFPGAPLWQRTLIVLAGPAANLLVAVAIIAAFVAMIGVPSNPAIISEFSDKSPAREAGLLQGDRIVAIDGKTINTYAEVGDAVRIYPGRTVVVTAERDGRQFEKPITLAERVITDQFGNETRLGILGIKNSTIEMRPVGAVEAVGYGFSESFAIMKMMAVGLQQIITGERSVKEMGGPVKIAKYSGEMMTLGWLAFVEFVALVSINLAFINLLPIPTLDGGHLAMYAAEAVRRKPLGARSQEWAFRGGMALVLAVAVFVTFNDLVSLFAK
ncbi:MAG TPA: RIP metalloprotease RseP [Novosphingobium sp.]|nr:RIP metalloprotease RseP [Novosphingobium sp.]